ncbi:hypothetical protein NPIL_475151 [Nephila pilipes]|uniref:Uncharacterized protein n=1 Tax=Nephila pilipes TaxID=299642 RepID=A0A8X6JW48_NEPPI|nr:hypothetical protein NPIL_475151 [Nephila pilipes]
MTFKPFDSQLDVDVSTGRLWSSESSSGGRGMVLPEDLLTVVVICLYAVLIVNEISSYMDLTPRLDMTSAVSLYGAST